MFSPIADISFLSTCASKNVYPETISTCSNYLTLFIANKFKSCQKVKFACLNQLGLLQSVDICLTRGFNLKQVVFVKLSLHLLYMSNEKKT